MKYRFLAFCLSGLSLSACDTRASSPGTSAQEKPGPADVEVNPTPAAIRLASEAIWKEPKVHNLDYRPRDTVQWTVAVDDDGSPRFGYAGYICMVLSEHGALAPNTAVRIADVSLQGTVGETDRRASLGAIQCADESRLDDAPAVG